MHRVPVNYILAI